MLELVRQNYCDFGPTLAAEVLRERHEVDVSRETLRRWMVEADLWLSRKQRRTFHQPRLRRESYGELVQIDGSEHRWFEGRGQPCTLLVFIDDATSKLMQLRFVLSESTASYFEALQSYLQTHGCPVAFYSDKHTVFRVNKPDAQGGQGMTQFGRALAELNIEILCANSSQAKGRVERANRTLQDRLVKELRIGSISDMTSDNAFLPGFLERFNERFSIGAAKANDLHRPLRVPPQKLNDILCHREQRYIGAQLTFHYDRKQIILDQTELAKGLAGQYVELYDSPDRPLEVRWKGQSLPYRIFSKDQRVSHTAIVENKGLGHALAIVKAQQDLKPVTKVMNNSESGRRTVAAGAAVLAISERQAYRLLARYEAGGGAELIHKARRQTSNRSENAGIRRYAVELVKTRYADSDRRWQQKSCLRGTSFGSDARHCGDG